MVFWLIFAYRKRPDPPLTVERWLTFKHADILATQPQLFTRFNAGLYSELVAPHVRPRDTLMWIGARILLQCPNSPQQHHTGSQISVSGKPVR